MRGREKEREREREREREMAQEFLPKDLQVAGLRLLELAFEARVGISEAEIQGFHEAK